MRVHLRRGSQAVELAVTTPGIETAPRALTFAAVTADEAERFTRRMLRTLHELPSAQRAAVVEQILCDDAEARFRPVGDALGPAQAAKRHIGVAA